MDQQPMTSLSLFDLLARQWQRRAAISGLCFNADGTLLAISAADGTVALARLADNEPPDARMSTDGGQTTIRPREGKPSPLINTRVQEATHLSIGPDGGFLVLTTRGELLHINRGGEIAGKLLADQSPISAFAYSETAGLAAAVVRDHLRLRTWDAAPATDVDIGALKTELLSISDDGKSIALAGDGRLRIHALSSPEQPVCNIPLPHRPLTLEWSPDGAWLACGMQQGGFLLVRPLSGESFEFADFPGPVGAIDWSNAGNALMASGAYRIAGWQVDAHLPSGNRPAALATGRAGFVLVATVAAHPVRKLAAAGYVSGGVVVSPIGSPEELRIREGGGPVTALTWSPDGHHLAIGDALGSVAIVTFPDQFFK